MDVKIYLGEQIENTIEQGVKVSFISEPSNTDFIEWNYYPSYPSTTIATFSVPLLAIPSPYTNEQMASDFRSFITALSNNFIIDDYIDGTNYVIIRSRTNGSPVFNFSFSTTGWGSSEAATLTTVSTDYVRLDLYKDESVNLTSKLSDIEKLSNVFTDFTNTFTVPSTDNNNDIFRHYYDVDIYNTFNANIRVPGYIEIDSFPLRYGKIQLEEVSVKSNKPASYKITFYGGVLQLTDLFGDDTIDRLDYKKNSDGSETKTWDSLSQFEYEYEGGNFINTINNPSFLDGQIITPLVAYTDRDWNYGSDDDIDISTTDGAILDTELRPAIRVKNIITGIESKYGISFTNDFFGKAVFNNLFLWMNKSEDVLGDEVDLDIINDFSYGTTPISGFVDSEYQILNLVDNYFEMFVPAIGSTDFISIEYWNRVMIYDLVDTTTRFKVYVRDYDTDELLAESSLRTGNDTTSDTSTFLKFFQRNETYTKRLKYSIRTNRTTTFKFRIIANMFITPFSSGPAYNDRVGNSLPNSQTKLSYFPLYKNIPNIKVIDFLQGLMKMFKLIIRPLSQSQFYIDTIDGYYSKGNILDITNYTDQTDVVVGRPLLYKNITFKYETTNNYLGAKWRKDNDPNDKIGYGDLTSTYASLSTKDNLEVNVPFENMLFERLTVLEPDPNAGQDTNISIGQSISSDDGETFSKNNSKPILFFNNGIAINEDYPFKIKFGDITSDVLYNYIIGNTDDELIEQVTNTINFGSAEDPWHKVDVYNSLYLNYWSNWINTIYSLRQRKFQFTAHLPSRFIEELSLNDRLIISDHRYKINDYTINLTTGETKFNLFLDIYDPYETVERDFNGGTFDFKLKALYLTDYTTGNEDGSYFVYGNFTQFNGATASRVIKINANGSQDVTFNANLGGPNSVPYEGMRLYRIDSSAYGREDGLYVTGFFSSYNGTYGYGLRKLHPNGTIDTTFSPSDFTATGGYRYTEDMTQQTDGKILLCGLFGSYSNVSSRCLVRISATGSIDTSFVVGEGFNNTVTSITSNTDNSVYATGYFTSYKGITAPSIIKLTSTASVDPTFNVGTGILPANTVKFILPTYDGSDSIYLMGNSATSYKGMTMGRVIKITKTGDVDPNFDVGTGISSGNANFIRYTQNNDRIFIGGSFSQFNGINTKNGVIIQKDGSIYQTFNNHNCNIVYNVGDDVYGIENNKIVKLTRDLELILYNDYIIANAGTKYYGINISSNTDWTIDKIDLGFGVSWVDILTPNGSGNSEICIRIIEKASQIPPSVYEDRKMAIKIKTNTIEKWVTILQKGL